MSGSVTKNLLELVLSGVEEIPEELLELGQEITELNLSWKKIKVVPEWFGKLKSIALLKLSGNCIRSLPENFTGMNLVSLDIQSNLLTKLPEDIDKLTSLEILKLRDNNIERLPSNIVNLQVLRSLNIRGNLLKKLPSGLHKLSTLEELILDDNLLTSLPQDIVYTPNLKYLSLESNQLHYMPFNRFTNEPVITIRKNRFLHYVSHEMGQKMDRAMVMVDAWHTDILRGCAEEKLNEKEIVHNRIVNVPIYGKNLALPLQLQTVYVNEQNYKPPSLLELTLRNLYKTCYRVEERRHCMQPKLLEELPHSIRKALEDGPVGTCYICENPVFSDAFFTVTEKNIFSRGHVGEFLTTFVYCSLRCFKIMKDFVNRGICPEIIECKLLQ